MVTLGAMEKISVDIWSDIICLWCPIGKTQFDAALAAFPHRDSVVVRHHSFQLDPAMPQLSSTPLFERAAQDMGTTPANAARVLGQVAAIAARVGLEYRLESVKVANSFDAHRLVHLATDHGRTEEVRGRLMRAFTTEGAVISDRDTLVRLAEEAGLDPQEAAAVLDGDKYADAVRADQELAHRLGVTGVPTYIVDGSYITSGSKDPEELSRMLDQALRKKNA